MVQLVFSTYQMSISSLATLPLKGMKSILLAMQAVKVLLYILKVMEVLIPRIWYQIVSSRIIMLRDMAVLSIPLVYHQLMKERTLLRTTQFCLIEHWSTTSDLTVKDYRLLNLATKILVKRSLWLHFKLNLVLKSLQSLMEPNITLIT